MERARRPVLAMSRQLSVAGDRPGSDVVGVVASGSAGPLRRAGAMHGEVLGQDRGGQLRGQRQQCAAPAGSDGEIEHPKPSAKLLGGDVRAVLAHRA